MQISFKIKTFFKFFFFVRNIFEKYLVGNQFIEMAYAKEILFLVFAYFKEFWHINYQLVCNLSKFFPFIFCKFSVCEFTSKYSEVSFCNRKQRLGE